MKIFRLLADSKKKIKLWLDVYLSFIGLVLLAFLIVSIGFYLKPEQIYFTQKILSIISYSFIVQEIVRLIIISDLKGYLKERKVETILSFLILLQLLFPNQIYELFKNIFNEFTFHKLTILYLVILSLSIFFVFLLRSLRYNHLISKINIHPSGILALSFAFIILIGTLFLMLPRAIPAGKTISFVDALFTSTSAVCVTGLTILDTGADFTLTGQIIILFLIQIGGLGIMTLTTFFAVFFTGGISLKVRIMMKDMISPENLEEVTGLLFKILSYTILIEAAGAFLLYLSLEGSFSSFDAKSVYSSIFHSVSAFCNAGFSLFSDNLINRTIADNYFFSTVIMLLIILGGLGFIVLSNLASLNPFRKSFKLKFQLKLQTKIVLLTTTILIFGGGTLIYLAEPFKFAAGKTFAWKYFHSVFVSVTSRTAGFNTTPTALLSPAVSMIAIVLMWIGASPGGTGGGIKTTTISITLLNLFNIIRGRERLEIFHKEIPHENINRSYLIILCSLIALGLCSTILMMVEPDKEALNLIFEATSALGTVGLSRDVTPYLGDGGKYIIIFLMYIGRIGVLTFFLAFYKPHKELSYSLPKEFVNVG